MQTYFSRNNTGKRLYILFLGWGMDEKPLLPFIKDENVLLLYDAKDLKIDFDFSEYAEFYIMAFSYGVMQYALVKDKLPHPTRLVALNGTLDMPHDLPQSVRQAMRGLTMENYLKFRRQYLVSTDEEYEKFNKIAPWRTIEDCMAELDKLEDIEKQPLPSVEFDLVYIAQSDNIIPTLNQQRFWHGKNIKLISGNHFALFNFKNISDIFA